MDDGEFITMDVRKGDFSFESKSSFAGHSIIVNPMILADMRYLPFKDDVFDIIVCDPPHMNCGLTGFMIKAWGSWNQRETIDIMKLANDEFSRCLKDRGTLVLKVMADIMPRFQKMLKNFKFFLPIQTVRAQGCIVPKEARKAALWAIAINHA